MLPRENARLYNWFTHYSFMGVLSTSRLCRLCHVFSLLQTLRLCLDIIKSTERNGAERSGMERSGMERNENTIPLFGNFRTEQDKLFILPKLKGKKNGGK